MISCAGALDQFVRSADYQLQISPVAAAAVEPGLVENPLRGAVEQRQERLGHDVAIKPEMHAGDRRDAQAPQIGENWLRFD